MTDSMPTNVVEALARVMAELPAIGKKRGAEGVKYAFRGIEAITAEGQELCAKYGVVPVPRVRSREVVDIVVNGNPWTDTYLEVEWTIYGPGGIEDFVNACTYGHGRDNSDKGTNKAMTQAFKYLLLPMLMISDKKDDNDGVEAPAEGAGQPRSRPQGSYQAPSVRPPPGVPETNADGEIMATTKQKNEIRRILNADHNIRDDAETNRRVGACLDRTITGLDELTRVEATQAISGLTGGTQ